MSITMILNTVADFMETYILTDREKYQICSLTCYFFFDDQYNFNSVKETFFKIYIFSDLTTICFNRPTVLCVIKIITLSTSRPKTATS